MIRLPALFAATALGLLSCAATEQDTPQPAQSPAAPHAELVEKANAQLRSSDLATAAWGAHAIAEFRLTACVPVLRARLKDPRSSPPCWRRRSRSNGRTAT